MRRRSVGSVYKYNGRRYPKQGLQLIFIEDPTTVILLISMLVVGLGIVPIINTPEFRLTRSKIAALAIVLASCIYQQSLIPALISIWPLSLIWFPEYWGNFTGHLQGPLINEKSPPVIIAVMGWFFLIVFPLFLFWIWHR